MATFKVGQRVRVVAAHEPRSVDAVPHLGHEGAITAILPANFTFNCWVRTDVGLDPFMFSELAPITDPGADKFIERIKKLSREPINEVPKVTVEK